MAEAAERLLERQERFAVQVASAQPVPVQQATAAVAVAEHAEPAQQAAPVSAARSDRIGSGGAPAPIRFNRLAAAKATRPARGGGGGVWLSKRQSASGKQHAKPSAAIEAVSKNVVQALPPGRKANFKVKGRGHMLALKSDGVFGKSRAAQGARGVRAIAAKARTQAEPRGPAKAYVPPHVKRGDSTGLNAAQVDHAPRTLKMTQNGCLVVRAGGMRKSNPLARMLQSAALTVRCLCCVLRVMLGCVDCCAAFCVYGLC